MRNGLTHSKATRVSTLQMGLLDRLEARTMLSTTAGSITLPHTATALNGLYVDYRHYVNGGSSSSSYTSSNDLLQVKGDKVAVTIAGTTGISSLTSLLHSFSGSVLARSGALDVVQAWIPITQLHSLSLGKGVVSVSAIGKGSTHQVGTSDNIADELEQISTARSTYGLDGTGVKIGVLSDSVNEVGTGLAQSIATGDLPNNVQVLQDASQDDVALGAVNDEGRAILELEHDLAPNAALAFATAEDTQLAFAQNILALKAAGANVIVDDVGYFAEPIFQEGVIDQAIDSVVNSGGAYFTSAANDANEGYNATTAFTKVGGITDLNFSPDGGVDTRLNITVTSPGSLDLQWDNPYNGVTGKATTNLDLYLYNSRGNRIISESLDDNLADGIPVESLVVPQAGDYTVEIRVAGRTAGSSLPDRFALRYHGPEDVDGFTTEYSSSTNDSALIGHAENPNAITVGAVDAADALDFNAGTSDQLNNESFSDYGPALYVFDVNGKRLPQATTINKPDVSGIDGINTSFFYPNNPTDPSQGSTDADSLPNFFGTSAAAPNVAAIAALIYQADPHATASQIRQALTSSASPLNGAGVGEFDQQGGYGLVNGTSAVAPFVANPTVAIQTIPTTSGSLSEIKIAFSQQVTNFNVSDLNLSFEGSENLLTGDNSPQTTDGGRSYVIPNLDTVTDQPGTYTLTLSDLTGITNETGLELSAGVKRTFTIIPLGAPDSPTALSAKTLSDSAILLRFSDNSDDEDGFTLQRSTASDFSTGLKTFHLAANTTSFTDSGLSAATNYYYRVRSSNNGGVSSFTATATALTLARGEVILDNTSSKGVTIKGSWTTSSSTDGALGDSYLDDGNTGKGTKSVTYTPNIEADGKYYVYIRYTSAPNRATNVPVTVSANGHTKTFTINQRKGGGGYILLGQFDLDAGTGSSVTISNTGTNGHVIADAVMIMPISAG